MKYILLAVAIIALFTYTSAAPLADISKRLATPENGKLCDICRDGKLNLCSVNKSLRFDSGQGRKGHLR
jgi:hypothetical protein